MIYYTGDIHGSTCELTKFCYKPYIELYRRTTDCLRYGLPQWAVERRSVRHAAGQIKREVFL